MRSPSGPRAPRVLEKQEERYILALRKPTNRTPGCFLAHQGDTRKAQRDGERILADAAWLIVRFTCSHGMDDSDWQRGRGTQERVNIESRAPARGTGIDTTIGELVPSLNMLLPYPTSPGQQFA